MIVVAVVVVVEGQTIGSISSKTLAYNCLFTLVSCDGIDDCHQLTRTNGGFPAQSSSKLLLNDFTVLLLTASLGRAFQVVVKLILLK